LYGGGGSGATQTLRRDEGAEEFRGDLTVVSYRLIKLQLINCANVSLVSPLYMRRAVVVSTNQRERHIRNDFVCNIPSRILNKQKIVKGFCVRSLKFKPSETMVAYP